MTICPNLSDDQVKMAFSKFDTSGDDKLDYREFCEMIRQKVAENFNLYKPGWKTGTQTKLILSINKDVKHDSIKDLKVYEKIILNRYFLVWFSQYLM